MGGGGKGGSTTVSKVEIPPEVLARYNAVNARAESVAQQPYQAYSQDPNAFVAPLTATQQAGIQNTNAMAGAAQPYYGAATDQLLQAQQGAQPYLQGATAATLAGGQGVNPGGLQTGRYMNPFTQNVVNATQAALNQQQGQQLAQQQAEAIRAGAFGGDRAGLQRAQLRGQQGLAQAQAISPLYQQAYQQALATAQQQQGVNLAAQQANRAALQQTGQQLAALGQQGYGMGAATSGALANLGQGAQQAGLAGAQAQLAAGAQQQQTQQAGLQALYNQFQQQQGFPYQQAQFLANIAEGTGALSGNQQTSTTTGGGGFFSDERLKENIEKVGETNDGQPIYRYNYKGDHRTQIGLLAQNVEKHHPEAVGLAGGFKTVDYKKATDDAVHKADGGDVTDAYSMAAPSQMLNRPQSALGALGLPQMVTGRDIPIQAGANAADIAAMRAPKVTGVNPESLAGARAERSSLQSSLAQGLNGVGAGPGYVNDRLAALNDFLAQNSSQGGLVGPNGGEGFARGGYADGGYMNPALQYYAPVSGQGGLYGVQLQPSQSRQMLQAQPVQRPAERNAIQEATQIAGLVKAGNEAWKARPDMLRTAEDIQRRKLAEDAAAARDKMAVERAKELDGEEKAHGGLAGGRDHFSRGGINPYGNGVLDAVLEDQAQTPQPQMMKGGDMPRQRPSESGIGQLTQLAGAGKDLFKGGKWAADKLGIGAAPTAMSSTSTAAIPEVIDLTSGAGLAGAGEAAAAAEGAGLLGSLGAGASAVGEGIMAALPFLGFLSDERVKHDIKKVGELFDGQPVYRFKYDGDDRTQMGLLAQKVEHHHPEAVGVAGGLKMVDYDRATEDAAKRRHFATDANVPVVVPEEETTIVEKGAPIAPIKKRPINDQADSATELARKTIAEQPVSVSRPEGGPARAPFKFAAENILPEGMSPGAKEAVTSENFWVPALSGIGAMLASPNKTLAGAIGSGLVGGTKAYTDLAKQQAEIAKAGAETRGIDVTTYQKSLMQTPAGNIVWLADGGIMLLGDYDELRSAGKAPPLLGRIPENADARVNQWLAERKAPKAPAEAKVEAKPAPIKPANETVKPAGEAPKPAESKEEPKPAANDYDDQSKAAATAERKVALSGGQAIETAKKNTDKYLNSVKPMATAARDSQRYLGELTQNLAEATKGKGLDAPGFGFSGRAQLVSALNTLSRSFGGSGDFGQADTINDINNKIETLQSSIAAAGGGQESVRALDMLKKAVANPNMSPRAYSQMAADLLTTNQRAIDREVHMSKYLKDSNGLLSEAAQDFDRIRSPDVYNREAQAIQKMILTQPELIRDLRSGKYTAREIDKAFEKQGLRNMSRYFMGGQ